MPCLNVWRVYPLMYLYFHQPVAAQQSAGSQAGRQTDRSSSHPKDGAHDVSQGTRITTSSSSSAGQTSSTPSSSSARITSQEPRPALVRRRCCLCSASASASAFASVSIFDFHLHLEAVALGSRLIVVRRVSLTGRSSRVLSPFSVFRCECCEPVIKNILANK